MVSACFRLPKGSSRWRRIALLQLKHLHDNPKKLRGETKPPIQHLVFMLTNISPDLEYAGRFPQMVHRVLAPFFSTSKSSRSRMELASDLVNLLPSASTEATRAIWQAVTTFATTAADTRDREESISVHENLLGTEYKTAVKILNVGINLAPRKPLRGWNSLFEAIVNSATIDAGDAGRAIAVIEPLANIFMTNASKTDQNLVGLLYIHLLLARAVYPRDRQALEGAKKRLWGTGNAGTKVSTFDPYVQLYDLLSSSLEKSYDSYSDDRALESTDILSTTTDFLSRCPTQLLLGALGKIQKGITFWILDPASKFNDSNTLSESVSTPPFYDRVSC